MIDDPSPWSALGGPIFWLVFGVLAISLVLYRAWLNRPRPEDLIEYPKIARMKVHRIKCRFCKSAFLDDEEVVWFERKNGWQSAIAHASCAVLLRHENGDITRIDGSKAPEDTGKPGYLVLTKNEWIHWRGEIES